MNGTRLAVWMIVAALASASAYASDIYRYVDADGNVYYVDRPTGADTEERVAIASRRSRATAPPATTADEDDVPETVATAAAADEASASKPTRSERKAARREREEKCQSYRARLETLETSRRLYREGEDGERVYLDESERQAARDRVAEMIAESCN